MKITEQYKDRGEILWIIIRLILKLSDIYPQSSVIKSFPQKIP